MFGQGHEVTMEDLSILVMQASSFVYMHSGWVWASSSTLWKNVVRM